MSDPVFTVVLCEDLQLRCFVRRFLIKNGWERRQIREVPIPSGGAGVTWVKEKLPVEMRAYRSRSAHAETCLIVGIDADHETVEVRIQALKAACASANVPFRADGERVAFVIPKRNTETWLAYLRGESVNETSVYPKYDEESKCRGQVARLDELCKQQRFEPEPPPDSLRVACKEFKRISRVI